VTYSVYQWKCITIYIYSTLFTKNGSNKKKTKTLTNFTKFTSQKLIIYLNQLNAVNRPFCCSLRRGRVYRANCIGPSTVWEA